MDEDIIVSPIFPVLYIIAVVASIVFGLTRDYKLAFLTGIISVISLVIFLKFLDSSERRQAKHARRISGAIRNFFPTLKDNLRVSNRGSSSPRSSQERALTNAPGEKAGKWRFVGTIIAAIIVVIILAAILNLTIYFN